MSPASRVMTRVGNNSEYSSEGPEEVQQSWDQFTASRGERERPKYGSTSHPATPGKFPINTNSAQTHMRDIKSFCTNIRRDKLGHFPQNLFPQRHFNCQSRVDLDRDEKWTGAED